MRLDETLAALGDDGVMGRRRAEVPVDEIVGTAERQHDFDHEFRLVNGALRDRWQRLEALVRQGVEPPPVTLVQLGELYFVLDGHHRVSVARALGRVAVSADVLRVCTVAYAMCCIRLAHLPSKAAERRFLERVPLPEEARTDLWLEDPAAWTRLADAAESWALREAFAGRPVTDRGRLAERWWADEVVPLLGRLRAVGVGEGLRDVALYATALAARDRHGAGDWPEDLSTLLGGADSGAASRGLLSSRVRR
jgi:hypothetical protein